MDMRFAFYTMATMLSVAVGEKCGYVRGPLAATNDTVVIKLDCNQSATSSHYVPPLQLRYGVTHVAVQLLHCRTVPVGLFTNATDHLTSVTVASEDAVQLLEGTFEGLEHVSEFRLIGFTALKNLSISVLKPLRNIRTVILDGFGRDSIELPYLGRVIRKLSGTPIRRLVLNGIKDLQNCTRLDSLNFSSNNMERITERSMRQLTQLALRKTGKNKLLVDLSHNKLHCLCNATHFVKWLQRSPAEWNIQFQGFDRYTCLYPNGSAVRVSEVIIDELEQQCSVIQTLVNGSDCPCDEEKRRRLQHVRVHLDRFFCRNNDGDLVSMNRRPFPSCFNAYLRASFIAPVVVGAILGIAFLITVGLLIYYRNSKPVKQVRECLEMNPVRFVRTAIQYVMMHNREEEPAIFRFDIIVFVQDDEQGSIHHHFVQALQGKRKLITRDDFLPGAAEVDAMAECIRDCQWVVPVITSSFLSDHVCVDFISRVQFSRPHALIPVVWEQSLAVTDISVAELLRTGDPLYWPGDEATQEDKRNFWSSLLEKTAPL